ncbi:hypothetical protein FBY22_3864 [Streptomyces sp. SLBN-31]|nr:hypothetical protein FBY22_3864 [Streptomyces sp. SLBN-31]
MGAEGSGGQGAVSLARTEKKAPGCRGVVAGWWGERWVIARRRRSELLPCGWARLSRKSPRPAPRVRVPCSASRAGLDPGPCPRLGSAAASRVRVHAPRLVSASRVPRPGPGSIRVRVHASGPRPRPRPGSVSTPRVRGRVPGPRPRLGSAATSRVRIRVPCPEPGSIRARVVSRVRVCAPRPESWSAPRVPHPSPGPRPASGAGFDPGPRRVPRPCLRTAPRVRVRAPRPASASDSQSAPRVRGRVRFGSGSVFGIRVRDRARASPHAGAPGCAAPGGRCTAPLDAVRPRGLCPPARPAPCLHAGTAGPRSVRRHGPPPSLGGVQPGISPVAHRAGGGAERCKRYLGEGILVVGPSECAQTLRPLTGSGRCG